ncbi:protein TolQ [Thiomicrorhabdus cannonii]|uniref:protein TolQ n=1 Tax=Thiomicrorhabdus cannonii TaxID=2748011 RepID=UPI0015BADABC|nr:protein TolQ [Thiomicrorhabdus cannonii]
MNTELMDLILMASPVVQAVMVILALMSIAAWAVALAKSYQVTQATKQAQQFEQVFWQTPELTGLFNQMTQQAAQGGLPQSGMAAIFEAGFREFVRLKKQGVSNSSDLIAGAQRAMKITFSKNADHLENRLSLLATVGSSAPYIGLFGTVWGVMHAFQSLGNVQNATLAAVAPGISEALIATAIGLFAAIPAVIAYNRLSTRVERLLSEYENFAEGFLTILQRQAHALEQNNPINGQSNQG